MNLAVSLLQALKDHGVREIFGIPGDFVLDFFKVIEETEILPLYTLSHEPAVGFAADGAARCRCAPSVAAATYGAGALNMVNAVACAYAEKSPVVVISGGPGRGESHTGILLHHQAKRLDSQFQIYREITCDQVHLDDPRVAGESISRALANCISQSRPIYIELPRDQVRTPAEPIAKLMETESVDKDALEACVQELVERLGAATSPVLMVGVEVRRFGLEQKVAMLARKLAIPVVTSFMGRGLLAETESPPWGTYMGAAGAPEICRMVENSDALLLLGVILSDTNFGISRRRIDLRHTVQALDGQVVMGHHVYPKITIKSLVNRLIEWDIKPRAALTHDDVDYPRHLVADDQPIEPDDVVRNKRFGLEIRAHAHRHGYRRLSIHFHAGSTLATCGSRVLCHDGIWSSGRTGHAGCLGTTNRVGGGRSVPNDRLGIGQLPPVRLGPHCDVIEQL